MYNHEIVYTYTFNQKDKMRGKVKKEVRYNKIMI